MNRIIRYLSFNTSHVTLYHWRGFKRLYRWEVSIHLMLLFIVSMAKQSGIGSRFNTSHVTLYLQNWMARFRWLLCFNTSHVTLYLKWTKTYVYMVGKFQYISCYSLSCKIVRNRRGQNRFNTSHVTLYPLVL